MSFALEELAKRASKNNLYIGTQGQNPPGPAVITYLEDGEDLNQLNDIRDELDLGYVYNSRKRRISDSRPSWEVYDEEAIQVLIAIMPFLKKCPRNKITTTKICAAGNLLGEWRRNHPEWRSS